MPMTAQADKCELRILFLIPSMTGVGGTERMVHALSTLLSENGYTVHQASFDPPGSPRHFESGVPLHALGPIPRLPLPLRPLAYTLAAWRLRKLKRRLGIDVTISNLWGADLVSALCSSGRSIALCHINVIGNPTNRLMLRLRPLVAAIYRRFDRVVAVSAPLAGELAALYRLPAGRVRAISNFTDVPQVRSGLPAGEVRRFVWCGRLVPEKNLEGLLWLWAGFAAGHTGVQLVLLGDGPLRPALEALAGELGLNPGHEIHGSQASLVFAGMVERPAEYLVGARAMLLTSLAEGLPMVLLEAMARGTPILAADCPPGGVRSALTETELHDPARANAELIDCGALLPVPLPGDEQARAEWLPLMDRAAFDDRQWAAWHSGALQRAEKYGPAAALAAWNGLLRSAP